MRTCWKRRSHRKDADKKSPYNDLFSSRRTELPDRSPRKGQILQDRLGGIRTKYIQHLVVSLFFGKCVMLCCEEKAFCVRWIFELRTLRDPRHHLHQQHRHRHQHARLLQPSLSRFFVVVRVVLCVVMHAYTKDRDRLLWCLCVYLGYNMYNIYACDSTVCVRSVACNSHETGLFFCPIVASGLKRQPRAQRSVPAAQLAGR